MKYILGNKIFLFVVVWEWEVMIDYLFFKVN